MTKIMKMKKNQEKSRKNCKTAECERTKKKRDEEENEEKR